MSYILDALRKSEHERQMAAGQTASLLFPQEFKRDSKPRLIPLIVLLAVASIAFVLWLRPDATNTAPPINASTMPAAHLPPAMPEAARTEPASLPEPKKLAAGHVQKRSRIASQADSLLTPSIPSGAQPTTTATSDATVPIDPLKEVPALNITGYIHNQQSGSLAMINNQLVHEGEEVSPGLRLIKIVGDSAIFSYKGYVFSR